MSRGSSNLTASTLLRAYAMGAFPMARHRHDERLFWVDPNERGIVPLDGFHLSRSLKRTIRRGVFTVRCDTAFEAVMRLCAEATPTRPDTWINDDILRLFAELHLAGVAHSVESWSGDTLIGGVYGLSLGSAFFGESMFSRATDASKVALAHLVARLKKGGYTLLDTQFITPHLSRFGAIEIPRQDYQRRLAEAISARAEFYGDLGDDEALALLSSQSNTQI